MKTIALTTLFLSFLFSMQSYAQELTQEHIDKVLATAPQIIGWFDENKQTMPKEAISMIGDGTFDGTLHTAIGKAVANDTQAMEFLDNAAIANGFNSYQEFASAADRAYSLLSVNTIMSFSASSLDGKTKVDNVFEYIQNENTPEAEKTRLQGFLPDMYSKMNADPNDLPIVLENFEELKSVLIR